MSKDNDTGLMLEKETPADSFQPDVYYFPVQVDAELRDIQNNILGKVLTIIDAMGLDAQQGKAIKDLIRTVVKEQMITTRGMLDRRLDTVLKLGMVPVDMESTSTNKFHFTTSYVVTPIYTERDMSEGGLLQ